MTHSILTPLDAARTYLRHHMAPVPVPYKEKGATLKGWPDLRLTEDELPQHFATGQDVNVGILLGDPSGGLIDADADAPEAVEAFRTLLPPTRCRHGRPGNPSSHLWYRVIDAPVQTRRYRFQFHDREQYTTFAELRGTGCQTLVPPSLHPDGEQYHWEELGEPATVDAQMLEASVARAAACALLAHCWPGPGSRDEAGLALSGLLTRAGWTVEQVDHFVSTTARIAGDEEWRVRGKGKGTSRKLEAGCTVVGGRHLGQLLGQDGPKVVQTVCEWLGIRGQQTQQSVASDDTASTTFNTLHTSPRYAEWPDPLSDAAYIGPVGSFVKQLAPQTEAAPEALLVQAIVAAGNAMGRHGHFAIEADTHHTNLFAVVVGATGSRKGVSWGQVRRFLKRADPAWESEHLVNGLSTGEGLISAVRDDEPQIADKVALAFESEFASVFKVKGREGNTLSTVLRQAWDGDTLRTMTKNTPLKATGAHISIVGHITPEELRRLMTATDAGNGFGNRILWVCGKRARYLPHGGEDVDLNAEVEALHAGIAYGRSAGTLRRNKEADALWEQRYRELSSGRPGLLGAVTNRAEAQVTRLSLVYALLDQSPYITRQHLEAALAVWEYCLASARYLFGAALGDALAEELDQELARHGTDGMSRTELYNFCGNNRSADEIAHALGILAEQNRAEKRRVKGDGGRTVDRWYAVTYDACNGNYATSAAYTAADGGNGHEASLNALFTLNKCTDHENRNHRLVVDAADTADTADTTTGGTQWRY